MRPRPTAGQQRWPTAPPATTLRRPIYSRRSSDGNTVRRYAQPASQGIDGDGADPDAF